MPSASEEEPREGTWHRVIAQLPVFFTIATLVAFGFVGYVYEDFSRTFGLTLPDVGLGLGASCSAHAASLRSQLSAWPWPSCTFERAGTWIKDRQQWTRKPKGYLAALA